MRRALAGFTLAALFAVATQSAYATEPWRVVFHNKGAKPVAAPLLAEIKENVPTGIYELVPEAEPGQSLKESGFEKIAVAQIFVDRGARYLEISEGGFLPRTSFRYRLKTSKLVDLPPGVVLNPNGSDLVITCCDIPVLTHRGASGPKPYIYPLFGPENAKITRCYPMADVPGEDHDHPHQRLLWFTHGNVNGFDFWASDPLNKPNKKFGSIKETSRDVVLSGMSFGIFRTTDDWLDPDGKPICSDERTVRIFPRARIVVNEGKDVKISLRGLYLDYDVTIKANHGPVTFGDTKEGMFGLRVASSMDVTAKKGGKITNAEGLTDEAAWGKASPWVDYVGPVDGKTVGVAILNHPTSFRYPTTWHVRTYGLFAANPFGWHDFGMKKSGEYTIPAGESITFRYRLVLHQGDTAKADIAEAFRSYAEPPTVEILPPSK